MIPRTFLSYTFGVRIFSSWSVIANKSTAWDWCPSLGRLNWGSFPYGVNCIDYSAALPTGVPFHTVSTVSPPSQHMVTHRLLHKWTEHWRLGKWCQHHHGSPTPYKIKLNNCILIDLVIRIQLTGEILMPQFSNFLRNSTIHLLIFSYMIKCFLRVTVSLLCWLQGRTISSRFTN